MKQRIVTATLIALVVFCSNIAVQAAEPFDPERLEKEVVVRACDDPMQLEVLPDGGILFIERYGRLKQFDPKSHKTEILGEIPVTLHYETGLLGFALDRSFAQTGWIYLFFCPKENRDSLRLSRFTIRDRKLDMASEIKLLDYHIDIEQDIHMGGGLLMDRKGNLHLGTGDNCLPIAEIPIDERSGRETFDAFRSSANSNDLRGKVLRIHPKPDGTYSIPAGNLFPEGRGGRPEIYTMGCRNAFRLSVDEETGWVYWGDVGPNVDPNLGIGPNGYDEVNQARTAGNFGWPQFIGPNEAYRNYNFETKKVGELFDVTRPLNQSRNNTGLKELPAPMPALIWYPSGPSDKFPALGSGGRSAMVGPVYHFDAANPSVLKLPSEFDKCLFVFDWTRNWVFTAAFDAEGGLSGLRPFMPESIFRKPIDMKIGPEGELYVIEYGDRWAQNTDSQIVRIVYRRGNRAPLAALQAEPSSGRQPLTVRLDATASRDRDKDEILSFAWSLNGKPMPQWSGVTPQTTFDAPGRYEIAVTVSDSAGAASKASTTVYVGNARPKVQVTQPVHGSFFNHGEMIHYSIAAEDIEDGSTAEGKIASDRLLLSHRLLQRRFSTETDASGRPLDSDEVDPGLALMRKTTCFSCHTTQSVSGGPPYRDVARKYAQDTNARERLAAKVISGGAGVWGGHAMGCRLLAACLNETDGIEAVVSPDLDWPANPDLLRDVNSIVFYSKPAGDILLAPARRKQTEELLKRGVGIVALHWSTGAEVNVGPEYEEILGGWFNFAHSGLNVSTRPLIQTLPTHPICRGWKSWDLRDEFYLNLKFSPKAQPVLTVNIDGKDQTVGWVLERNDGGRSFGCTLGHFHENFSIPEFRKLMINGILWTAKADVPEEGAPVEIDRRLVDLPPQQRPFVKEWKMDQLLALLEQPAAERSFANGEKLFQSLSCTNCHRMRGKGGQVGPELTEARSRLAKFGDARTELLREIAEPSHRIDEKFKSQILELADGRVLAGIVIGSNDQSLRIAAEPAKPDEIREIPLAEIEERHTSLVSLMPAGLLNTLQPNEILDLVAYVESGGDPQHSAYKHAAK